MVITMIMNQNRIYVPGDNLISKIIIYEIYSWYLWKTKERNKENVIERKEKMCINLIPSYVIKSYDLNGTIIKIYRVRLEISPKWIKLGQQSIIEDLKIKSIKSKYPPRFKYHYKT